MGVRVEAEHDLSTGRMRLLVEADTAAGFDAALAVALTSLGREEPKRAPGTPKRTLRKLTDEQAREIRRRHLAGEAPAALGKEYGLPLSPVYKMLRGRTYTNPEAQP